MLKAGTSIVDISPEEGIELAGYPHFPRHNTGINDPLYASCIYLDSGETKIALIAMDILFFSRKYVREVRRLIQKETGIPEGNIFISVSHTHSGPWAAGRLDMEALEKGQDVDREYVGALKHKIVRLASDAASGTFNASIGTNSVLCGKEKGIGGNRRHPGGPADPLLWTVAVKDDDNTLRAAIVKYALHPTVIHEDSTLVTADYPGYARKYLKSKFPDMNMLFMQGTSGDQSTRYFRQGQDFEEARRIGDIIGECAASSIKDTDFKSDIGLAAVSQDIGLPLKQLPSEAEAAEKTRAEWERLKSSDAPYIEVQNANLRNLGAENTLGYVRLKKKGTPISLEADEIPPEVQVITIGDARIAGLPGEVFVQFGLDIQKKSAHEKTIVVELANGCLPGYVCTPEAIKEGGYEAGATMLSGKAGDILVQTAVSLLQKS
jgi:neutral ceramidase